MKRENINNPKINSIGYGVFSSKLEIEFTNGEIVQFSKVPSDIFEGIKGANCCFKYYENNIKGIFDSRAIEEKF